MSWRIAAAFSVFSLSAGAAQALDLPNPLSLFGGGKTEEKPTGPVQAPSGAAVDCPEILVDTGTATLRSPPGSDNASVRYQLSLGELARECSAQGEQITIKVGVEGAAVLGPAGQPGSFSGAVRVAVRRQKDEAVLQSRTYHIQASIPSGQTRGEFRLIADPLVVPYLGPQAADDYEILVGFEGGSSDKSAVAPKRAKRRAGQ
jgi:hypothetical protein